MRNDLKEENKNMMRSEYEHSELTEQIIGAADKAARFEIRPLIIPHQC
jgi:hypothetical protein